MEQNPNYVIWLVRRDLRLENNRTLMSAAETGGTVIPLFVIQETADNGINKKFNNFLLSGLNGLDTELEKLNSGLLVKIGDPVTIISAFSKLLRAPVFVEEDYSPPFLELMKQLNPLVELKVIRGLTIFHPSEVTRDSNHAFKVYSQFRKKWESLPRPKVPITDLKAIRFVHRKAFDSDTRHPKTTTLVTGAKKAKELFHKFLSSEGKLLNYGSKRSRVDYQTTSHLSPFINLGMISVESIFQEVSTMESDKELKDSERKSINIWLNELIWREFFQASLFHFPESVTTTLRPDLELIEWNSSEKALYSWQEGFTGYPIVDAAMRQLKQEGWIHNRLRMIVASFLVKDLLIDWREGANWFGKHLVDIETAANVGGWQWTAGTGLDAAPYFRVFNPILQGKKFDPKGEYVRTWIPELNRSPDKVIHEPWKTPIQINYLPKTHKTTFPIIDHYEARRNALDSFEKSRSIYKKAEVFLKNIR
ncbi:MAG: hypothetical protein CL791_04930 [Chloroflexi bacterium]|nr:hypothetical protein [Chloroflexota bacterium]